MYMYLVGDPHTELVYRTKNTYTKKMRFIYYFANVSCLIETVTECFCFFILDLEEEQDICGTIFFIHGYRQYLFAIKIWKVA